MYQEASSIPISSSQNKMAAALFEERPCFLDHLIPFCHLFQIPLLSHDHFQLSLAEQFYPPISTYYCDHPATDLDCFDFIFYAQPYHLFPQGLQFPRFLYPKKIRSCCTLHGNSEKYQRDFWLERLLDEDIVLIYGQLLVDLLIKKGIYHRLKNPIICGNLRYQFYKENQTFFDQKVDPFLWKSNKKKIFWAPTWSHEQPYFFFTLVKRLVSLLPHDFQLTIKLHPLMKQSALREVEEIMTLYKEHSQVMILDTMPLVYPFLQAADIFLGDVSSVAYDFLVFKRPMYFFASGEEAPFLHSFGRVITPDEIDFIFHIMSQQECLVACDKSVDYAFATEPTLESIRQQIEQACQWASLEIK